MSSFQFLSHAAWIIGYLSFHFFPNASNASCPASAVIAEYTSFRSLHTALRSLYETNFVELRTMWTMQCCIWVSGKTALTASGNPVSPSIQAISISSVPRFFISVNTPAQNFAPSVSASHRPRTSFLPSQFIASATYNALLTVLPSCQQFTRKASRKRIGYDLSSGLFCHSFTSSITASVTWEIRSAETVTPYTSCKCR